MPESALKHHDKSKWGDGPWQHEPDMYDWVDADSGYRCLMFRNMQTSGAWLGYVVVPVTHPWHGMQQGDVRLDELDVHGGVTFVGTKGDDFMVGFDTAHIDDYMPMCSSLLQYGPPPTPDEVASYKDMAYVQRECAHLAKQIADFALVWHR